MKKYNSEETRTFLWLKRQKYLSCSDITINLKYHGYELIEKFPVKKIVFNPENYPNKIVMSEVMYMLDNFHPIGYYPLIIDENNILLDGQHRLKLAELCCIDFVDVFLKKEKI